MRPAGPRHLRRGESTSAGPSHSSAASSSSAAGAAGGSRARGGGGNMDRDQVFASIFGRSAGGHHAGAPTPLGGGGGGRPPPAAPMNGNAGYARNAAAAAMMMGDPYAGLAPPLPPPSSSSSSSSSAAAAHMLPLPPPPPQATMHHHHHHGHQHQPPPPHHHFATGGGGGGGGGAPPVRPDFFAPYPTTQTAGTGASSAAGGYSEQAGASSDPRGSSGYHHLYRQPSVGGSSAAGAREYTASSYHAPPFAAAGPSSSHTTTSHVPFPTTGETASSYSVDGGGASSHTRRPLGPRDSSSSAPASALPSSSFAPPPPFGGHHHYHHHRRQESTALPYAQQGGDEEGVVSEAYTAGASTASPTIASLYASPSMGTNDRLPPSGGNSFLPPDPLLGVDGIDGDDAAGGGGLMDEIDEYLRDYLAADEAAGGGDANAQQQRIFAGQKETSGQTVVAAGTGGSSRLSEIRRAMEIDGEEGAAPPPLYSSTSPMDHRSSAASGGTSDLARDLKGLNLFDSNTRASATRSPDDFRTDASSSSFGQQKVYKQPSHGSVSNMSAYADELRDSIHPVRSSEQYNSIRSHRRQGSESSVVSTSTMQSNYAPPPQAGRRSGSSGLAPLETTRWERSDNSPSPGSPALALSTMGPEGFVAHDRARMSTDSVRSMSHINTPGNRASFDHRALSFSGQSASRDLAVTAVRAGSMGHGPRASGSLRGVPSPTSSTNNLTLTVKHASQTGRQTPQVYPAMMSRVAEVFKTLVPLGDRLKDGLTYKDAFEGREAVDLICDIIRTSDRNLALLLGRALDSQKFFHDVTYNHRLRDSGLEIYRFRERLPSPFVNSADGDEMTEALASPTQRPQLRANSKGHSSGSISAMTSMTQHSSSGSPAPTPSTSTTTVNQVEGKPRRMSDASSEEALPVGVFTLLTDCYSPTCTRDQLCYSINCPRRLEQQKRLNMKIQPGLTRRLSTESLGEVQETGTLWIHSVSQEVLDSIDDTEKKRQEAINELIYTERDFVRDMEYLRDSWVTPLRTNDVIPIAKREDFVTQVFWNVHEVLGVNAVLADRLTKRQKQSAIVHTVGDILLECVPRFEPFVRYGAHQLFGKYEFEKEKGNNPAFQKFVDDTERDPASRKLELNGYLTKPTTRLARYPLLLQAILKITPEGNPDKEALPKVIDLVKDFLARVNVESGKSENMFNLAQLDQQLVFRPGEQFDLHLRDKNRELVYKGPLKCRGGPQGENADLLVFLFDHALLLVKPKWVNKHEQYKVYRKPIPLELLVLTSPDAEFNTQRGTSSKSRSLSRPGSTKSGKDAVPKPESKHGYSLTLIHLGRKGYTMTLWAATYAARKKWLEHIDEQHQKLRERSRIFDSVSITDRYFGPTHKLNCAVPYDGGRRMIYGSDDGVYFSNLRDERLRYPTKVLTLPDVTQVDVLEEFQLLIVLAERSVTSYPLEALDPNDPTAALKRGKRLSSHTSFFKSGVCLGRTLLCIVKSSSLSSTIKTLEPVNLAMRNKKQPTPFRKLLNNNNEPFTLFKEFYIPTESSGLSFLKTKLCVATTRGFEVVDLETLDTQGLLDPSDSSLDFVAKRENVHPIAIYRVEDNFLLCYAEFAFYVNKTGWRAKHRWAIQWEGYPHAFALHYPYVLAFEPNFIEVRHVDTGGLVQIVTGSNIRCLFSDTPPSQIHSAAAHAQLMAAAAGRLPYGAMGHGVPAHSLVHGGSAGGYVQQAPYPHQQHPYGHVPAQQQHPQSRLVMPPVNHNRNQIIFISEDSNVQVLRLVPPAMSSQQQQAHANGVGGGSMMMSQGSIRR